MKEDEAKVGNKSDGARLNAMRLNKRVHSSSFVRKGLREKVLMWSIGTE